MTTAQKILLVLWAALVVATLSSCGGTGSRKPAATLNSIAVTPASPSIGKGATQQFTATGTFSDGSTSDLTSTATWSSDNTAVASISSAGKATGVSPGTANITASQNGVTSPADKLTVTPPTLSSIAVTPASPSVTLGQTKQFTATGTFSDSSTQNLTASVNWTSSNTAVATISNSAGTQGLATASASTSGSATITATDAATNVKGSTTLTVTATLQSILVTAASASVAAGSTDQFTATGQFSDGSSSDVTATATWASDNTSAATISNASGSHGLATGVSAGVANITAAQAGITSNSFALTVTASSGGSSNAKLNGHYAFLFNGWDDSGNPLAMAGSFVADGSGGLSGVAGDINRGTGSTSLSPATGTYSVNATDNRGTMTFGGATYKFALNSFTSGVAHRARFIEFDDSTGTGGTRGSGVLELQDTAAFTQASIANDYAFGVSGALSGGRIAMAGRFTAGSGSLTSGHADLSASGFGTSDLALSGTYAVPSGSTSGRGTTTMTIQSVPNIGNVTVNFALYIVSAHELFLVSTDATSSTVPLFSGQVLQQSGGPFTAANSLNGNAVFYVTGLDASHGTATNTVVGFVNSTGNGSISGVLDQNADDAVVTNVAFTGTLVLDASGNGRGVLTFQLNSTSAKPQTIYMVKANEGFVLEGTASSPGNDATLGLFEPQSGGFALSGAYSLGSVEPATSLVGDLSGVFSTASATTLSGTSDESDPSGNATLLNADQAFTGVLTAPDSHGRSVLTVTQTSSGHTDTEILWIISPTRVVGIDGNQSGGVATHTNTAVIIIEQ